MKLFNCVVIRAFDIFSPMSDGNFHHLCKLMESLLVREKSQVLDILLMTMPNQKPFPTDSHEALTTPIITKPLIFRCILYLQESPVCQIIIRALFSVPMETEEQIQAQKFRYACLQQEGFIECLIDIVLLNQDQGILHIYESEFAHMARNTGGPYRGRGGYADKTYRGGM